MEKNVSYFSTTTHSSKTLLLRLVKEYIRPYTKLLALAVVCMIVVAATTAINAWLMEPVLDKIFLEKDHTMLLLLPLAVIILAITKAVATYGQFFYMRHVGQRVISDIQLKLYAHLLRADLKLFHDQAAGKLISRFTNDIQMMREAVSNVLTGVAREALTLVFLVGLMFYQSWELAIIAFILFPVAIYPILKLGRRMRKLADHTQVELGKFTEQLDETFRAAREVKAYGMEEVEIRRAKLRVEEIFRVYAKGFRIKSAASPLMEMLAGLTTAAVIWYGGSQVLEGHTTPGAFFSFMTAMIMAYRPVKSISGINTNLEEGLSAANRVFQVLDTPADIADRPQAMPLKVGHGHLRFDGVTFHYLPGRPALLNLTLDLPAGKTIALVGHSGSGKSTVMNLLLRFYDVDSGRITFDGEDIREVTLASLRAAFSFVGQEPLLFDDSVRANIAYGTPAASEDQVVQAAKAAAAHEFIMQLPAGYETRVGPHGAKLSGGQRQRIAIARALLRNAPVLLLDEATSALDTVSEQQVHVALEALKKGRTTLVIAHRLSTVMNADLIYVLSEGRCVESGTHGTLLAKGGEYAALYARQFREEEPLAMPGSGG